MKIRLFAVALLFAAVLGLTFGQGAYAKGNKMVAHLTGSTVYPNAKGKAAAKSSSEEKEFEVEVQHLKSLAGSRLTVFVDGNSVGTMRVSALGKANLNLNSNNGANVPAVASGTTVQIKTGGGTLVASGTF